MRGFLEVAALLEAIMADLDRAKDMGPGAVMIETKPIATEGGMLARTWGPHKSADDAENWINVKRDRYRIQSASIYGPNPRHIPQDDKELLMHPELEYRCVPCRTYFSRFAGQMMMTLVGTLVEYSAGTTSPEFKRPTEGYGITDDDETEE